MAEAEKENKDAIHDDVVLQAKAATPIIADQLGFILDCPRLSRYQDPLDPRLVVEMEYEINDASYVDLAVFWDDDLSFLMEIKSKREPQTASGWTRQLRRYEKAAKVPAALVVAHDLGDVQAKYLREADVHVVDLRKLPPVDLFELLRAPRD